MGFEPVGPFEVTVDADGAARLTVDGRVEGVGRRLDMVDDWISDLVREQVNMVAGVYRRTYQGPWGGHVVGVDWGVDEGTVVSIWSRRASGGERTVGADGKPVIDVDAVDLKP